MLPDLSQFDPNGVGVKSNNIFGLPFSEKQAGLILLPVPWEVTVSYRRGTSTAPESIFDASLQIDLYDADTPNQWKKGIYMMPVDSLIRKKSDYLRKCAELIIATMEEGELVEDNEQLLEKQNAINEGSIMLNNWVYEMTKMQLDKGKKVGLVGGEHSVPLGYIKALAERHPGMGILQIDAHADLRNAYEGFTYSHASIMYNVLAEIKDVSKLVQVGIRDISDDEIEIIQQSPDRIATFFDQKIKEQQYEGKSWKSICDDIIAALPNEVYISFDIDGLDPKLCPNTGTPVPGGFEIQQVFYLLKKLQQSGKKILGFDLNEVSPGAHSADGIDSIVGARVLYKLCNLLLAAE